MSNEHYLLVSYVAAAGLGLAAAVGTALILAGPHREVTGGPPRRLGRLFRRLFPPWLVLAVAFGFVSVSYIDCEHGNYEAVVGDRDHLYEKSREHVRWMAGSLAASLFMYGFALVPLLWARTRRKRGASPKPSNPAAKTYRQAVFVTGLAAALAAGGCSNDVTFEGREAEPVCRLLEEAVDVELHKKLDVEPGKPANLRYPKGFFSTDYSLTCGVETWGDRTTTHLGLTGYNILDSLWPWRCEGAASYIWPSLGPYGLPIEKTPSGVKVTCYDSWVIFLADCYAFKVETSPVPEGVRSGVQSAASAM